MRDQDSYLAGADEQLRQKELECAELRESVAVEKDLVKTHFLFLCGIKIFFGKVPRQQL